ncbi:hypothetical protein B0H15DRAFT_871482 [Mycena belliarum]|uniref:Uncharacterized protein n=1 Tax=Mycena belliarum TaxID=1033014 RepID=A0AAD6TLB9_9AGAR|nr:hypothetical protein B0H15DRAFT_871482 [Mycena belliae]
MPPFPDMAPEANTRLDATIECSSIPWMPTIYSTIFVFFLLALYALALWDRWLNLKFRESERLLAEAAPHFYGSTRERPVRLPSVTITPAAAPSAVLNSKAGPSNSMRTSKQFPPGRDERTQFYLAPPTVLENENTMDLGASHHRASD